MGPIFYVADRTAATGGRFLCTNEVYNVVKYLILVGQHLPTYLCVSRATVLPLILMLLPVRHMLKFALIKLRWENTKKPFVKGRACC